MSGPRVLFVCLGNICRSPLAEAAFRDAAARAGLEAAADSAGVGAWHVGAPPDPRAQAVARRRGLDVSALRGRQATARDFERFDLILAMDHDNLRALRALRPEGARARLALLLDMVEGREGEAVADPYYGEAAGYETTCADVSAAAQALVRRLAAEDIPCAPAPGA